MHISHLVLLVSASSIASAAMIPINIHLHAVSHTSELSPMRSPRVKQLPDPDTALQLHEYAANHASRVHSTPLDIHLRPAQVAGVPSEVHGPGC